mmetsp:Transcript_17267/g.43793  ORF Transcript_17267/g.43793 Transcript_17267/m.43793 type:complete len:429 (-) Transcript_17267:55-1341(-)
MRRDWEALGRPPVFTYELQGGKRRMTIVADRDMFRPIFFPDGKALSSNQAALAHHWFGIEKELSMAYTDLGLKNTRKALKQSKARRMNDTVATGIMEQFTAFGAEGEVDLMDFAWLTFWPVNAAMFGADAVSPAVCPHIRDELVRYNANFEAVANGMPRAMFPEMEVAAQNISKYFGQVIDQGLAEREDCPVLKARVDAIDPGDKRWSSADKGRFVMSVFWAAQANTIPGTFWALAMALADPAVKAKCEAEARGPSFASQPDADGHFDVKNLPYLDAVVKEMLRLKVANVTHRKVHRDIGLRAPDGKVFEVPKGDTVTVCSHLQHMDGATFGEPERFYPDRWLSDEKIPPNSFFPFGGGPNTCSGKFLAMQEVTVLLGLFFREFDAELVDSVPESDWENVVAMVGPVAGSSCRVRFKRRADRPTTSRL